METMFRGRVHKKERQTRYHLVQRRQELESSRSQPG
jgi:hypothetical protein